MESTYITLKNIRRIDGTFILSKNDPKLDKRLVCFQEVSEVRDALGDKAKSSINEISSTLKESVFEDEDFVRLLEEDPSSLKDFGLSDKDIAKLKSMKEYLENHDLDKEIDKTFDILDDLQDAYFLEPDFVYFVEIDQDVDIEESKITISRELDTIGIWKYNKEGFILKPFAALILEKGGVLGKVENDI